MNFAPRAIMNQPIVGPPWAVGHDPAWPNKIMFSGLADDATNKDLPTWAKVLAGFVVFGGIVFLMTRGH